METARGNRRYSRQGYTPLQAGIFGVRDIGRHGALGHEHVRNVTKAGVTELVCRVPAPAEDLTLREEGQAVAPVCQLDSAAGCDRLDAVKKSVSRRPEPHRHRADSVAG